MRLALNSHALPFRVTFGAALSQLTLPAADNALPYEQKHFTAENRWFDFSEVTLPWPEFQEMGDDPEVCRPDTQDGGDRAFGYESEKK